MLRQLKTFTKVKPLFQQHHLRNLATITEPRVPSLLQTKSHQTTPGYLKLQSGQTFFGKNFGSPISASGEAVFTTSPVGYPESMTDPSYKGQILIFTQPLIGNYGVPDINSKDKFGLLSHFESDKIQVNGIIVNDYAMNYSHWSAVESLAEWCHRNEVPALSGIDTRALVQLLRDSGTTLANINQGDKDVKVTQDEVYYDPSQFNLVDQVSTKFKYSLGSGNLHIAVIDCGIKHNILRHLLQQSNPNHQIKLTVLPWDYNFVPELHLYDGLFISNGPGNPSHCTKLINNLKHTLQDGLFDKPIFGICMGNQILGKALDLPVYKMQFGNRGHNQPCINQLNDRCYITSQNHGYALNTDNLPNEWNTYFVNANDQSNEGIIHKFKPISSVQFHPEAKGGPEDTTFLFQKFFDQIVQCKANNKLNLKEEIFVNPSSIKLQAVEL